MTVDLGGRPTTYNKDIAAKICARMSEGESLRSVCRSDGFPVLSTVFLWIGKYPEFSEQYKLAMASRADAWFEDMIEIADDGRNDFMETEQGEKFNSEHVQRSRLRLDTRKWMLSKMLPKKYGDKQTDEAVGNENDITINVVRVNKNEN